MTAIDAMPERLQPARAANLLLWVIAAFVVVAVAWAALARIDTVTRGQGRVIPSLQLQRVAHLEGGIVREILVRQGARVARGQLLILLDTTQSAADLGRGSVGRDAQAARLTRLTAEAAGLAPVFDPAVAAAAPDQVAAERALWRARRIELDAALSVARARLTQAERAEVEAASDAATRAAARGYAVRDLAMIAPLVDKGIEPLAEKLRAEAALAQAEGLARTATAARARAAAAVREAREDMRAVAERFRAQTATDLAATRAEFAGSGQALPALADRMARTRVTAPIAGTVNRVLVNTVGGIVRPGEPLVEIVPADDTLVVETRVAPKDIGFIRPGQAATIKVTAYDSAIYGNLKGTVERISPDAVVDEAARESFYMVRVRTRDMMRDASGRPLPIVPGMIAEVDVLGNPRSVLSYLLTPLERVRDSALRER